MSETKLIVALDYDRGKDALEMAAKLHKLDCLFKVGLQLYTNEGPDIIVRLRDYYGCKIFLDLKFHDIPNTVYGAVMAAANLGVEMLTIHASGGAEMIKAARQACEDSKFMSPNVLHREPPILLAVTILTHMKDRDGLLYHWPEGIKEAATYLFNLAMKSGAQGVVCSGLEFSMLKTIADLHYNKPEDPVFVIPGIRPADYKDKDDQQRVITPEKAAKSGMDYIVVGRPITKSDDPLRSAEEIIEQLKAGE